MAKWGSKGKLTNNSMLVPPLLNGRMQSLDGNKIGLDPRKVKTICKAKEKEKDTHFNAFVATLGWQNEEHGLVKDCSAQASDWSWVKWYVHRQTILSKLSIHR